MSLHIQRFVDRVNSCGGRDIVIPLADARAICNDITHLLIRLSDVQDLLIQKSGSAEVLDITVSGGGFR